MKYIKKAKDLAKYICDPRYYNTYKKFRDYTLIPPTTYVANLKLACRAASIPGAIVECGTWKGGMIAGIAETFGKDRDYFLFDSFEGLPDVEPVDGAVAKSWQEATNSPAYFDNCTASEEDAATAMSLARITDANLVKGWFENTLPKAKFPDGIAILRMDGDWYKSTYEILSSLFPAVNENGLIIIDDYYYWDGCTKAVHDYLSEHKRPERISSYRGVCFIRKRKV
jgi:O-methyltransferase